MRTPAARSKVESPVSSERKRRTKSRRKKRQRKLKKLRKLRRIRRMSFGNGKMMRKTESMERNGRRVNGKMVMMGGSRKNSLSYIVS